MSSAMKEVTVFMVVTSFVLLSVSTLRAEGLITGTTWKTLRRINKEGPFLGLVVPNSFEMSPLLQSSNFVSNKKLPYLDYGGRRFRFGTVGKEKVVMVMTGLSMLNAGLGTQLLLDLFDIKGVLHFGIAGNANPDLQIGDVTIPHYWSHTGLWYWQRYGQGLKDQLALEAAGDYTREIGPLNFSDYSAGSKQDRSNLLNSVWYQPEEIFPVTGTPEVREHAFWIAVDSKYYDIAKKLEGMELSGCVNSTTCLPKKPAVVRVLTGCSANVFVDNAAYRKFLRSKFDVTAIDMESAAVGLVCLQRRTPFIAFRSLSDLAGGGSGQTNEADVFGSLAAQNVVTAVVQFISLVSQAN